MVKGTKRKRHIQTIIAIITIAMIIYITYGVYKESKIKLGYETEKINYEENRVKEELQKKEEQIKKEQLEREKRKKGVNVSKQYLGYKVDAYLEIPKLDLQTEVLTNYSKQGLEVCVSKYWGPNPNEIGNYCIAGHNYITSRMFSRLKNLEIGDKIILSDNTNGKYTYKIYDIYKSEPDNVECLSQDTDEKREITLITCNNYSKNRLILKAREE